MINVISELIATVLDVVFLIWFLPSFHKTNFKKNKMALIIPALLLCFQLVADNFLEGFDILYLFVYFLFSGIYSYIFSGKKIQRTILSSCIYVAIIMLLNSFVYVIFSLFVNDMDIIIQARGTIATERIIYLISCKLTQFATFKFILRIFRSDDNLDIKNSLLVFFFTIITAGGLGALMAISSSYHTDQTSILIFTVVVVLILSNIALYYLIYQVQKLLKSKYELKLLQEKMNFEKSRYEEATVVWDNIRKVRHDMKNHFAVVSGHLKNEDIKSCEEYIEQIMPSVESMGNLLRSNNSVLDYLINSKLAGLKETQIVISGIVSNFNDVEDTDLASVIGNILDNAVEAQEKVLGTKRIELLFRMKNDNRVIICKNTVAESVLKTNKELRSTKKNHDDHGLGHQIVETILKKYDGWVDYFETEDMFGAQIMLPMPKPDNTN